MLRCQNATGAASLAISKSTGNRAAGQCAPSAGHAQRFADAGGSITPPLVPPKAHNSLKILISRIDSRPRWRYSQAQIPNTDTGFGSLLHPAAFIRSPEL